MSKKFTNFYEHPKMKEFLKKGNNPHFEDTQIELNSRVLVVGASGTGKTNALLQYISLSPNTFSKVIVVYKEDEPLYQLLREGLKNRVEFLTDLSKLGNIAKIRDKMDKDEEVLLVIDDHIMEVEKASNVGEIFVRGRKCGITTFFLAQSYFKCPKILRQQMNYLILLKMSSNKDINLILSDFGGKDPEEIRRIYKDATSEKLHFLKINTSGGIAMDKKFSKNWNDFYDVKDD